jgi:hypothetical protein
VLHSYLLLQDGCPKEWGIMDRPSASYLSQWCTKHLVPETKLELSAYIFTLYQVTEFSFIVIQWSRAWGTLTLSVPQNAIEHPHRPWECLDHPPFRPDLAPSNFYFCGPLWKHFKGKHLWHDKTEAEVRQCAQTLSSFLPQRNWKCVASQG